MYAVVWLHRKLCILDPAMEQQLASRRNLHLVQQVHSDV